MLLRHGAFEHKLSIRPDGYVVVSSLLVVLQKILHRSISEDTLRDITVEDKKGRFSLQAIDGVLHMRANQGHSGEVGEAVDMMLLCPDSLKTLADLPADIIHGTYKRYLPSILSSGGLHRQARSAVHFAAGLPGETGVISGLRKSAECLIYLDREKLLAAKLPIFRSSVSLGWALH
jgi:2'-phosphotransferase